MWSGYSIWPQSTLTGADITALNASPFLGLDWNGGPASTCTYGVAPDTVVLGPGTGIDSVTVTASASTCPWSAVSNATWLTITSGTTGQGSGAVSFSTTPSATARTGTMTVAGRPVTISQDGDTDGDGLLNSWETATGLDPASASGADGATGDADGDGRSNQQEFQAGTHPRGFHARYLAEGAVNSFFDVRLALLNVGPAAARVQLRLLQPGGAIASQFFTLPRNQRRTLTRTDLSGLTSADFSTVVESDQPIVLDRTMSWDASGYGSHAETGVAAPATTWYLAEGSTSGDFALFYLLQNAEPDRRHGDRPLPAAAGTGADRPRRISCAPSRAPTIPVDGEGPELASTDVSAVIEATAPIIVERAMYMTRADRDLRGRPRIERRHRTGDKLVPGRRGYRSVLRSVHPARQPEQPGGVGHRRLPAVRPARRTRRATRAGRTAASRSGSTTSSCRPTRGYGRSTTSQSPAR